MSYLIYISYTPYTVYVIHNLCICLPVNGWSDHCLLYLRITWKSVDSLPSGNAWSERCLLWIAPQLPMVRLAPFITFSPPSSVHHPNICSPANARPESWSLTKHWSDWCCLLLPDNCFRTCTMLPMLTMYTCAQKHDDLASHRPLPCTREKRAKSMFDGFTFSYGFLFSCIAGSRATLCTDQKHKIDSPIKIEKKPVLQFQTEPPVQAPVQAGS